MALKAGYIGVKKSLLGVINSLSSAKFIKSFGDGLSLSDAGKLSLTSATASTIGGIKVGSGVVMSAGKLNLSVASDESLGGVKAGEGVSIDEDGTLNVTASGMPDYSETEFATGQKWIDGKDIYGIVKTGSAVPANGAVLVSNVDFCIYACGATLYDEGTANERWYEFPYGADCRWELWNGSHDIKFYKPSGNPGTAYKWVFFYTKIEEE